MTINQGGIKVIIACEFSGVVRDAFIKRGFDAVSCDILPSERPGPHIQGDIREVDLSQFALMIAHPPCTHLAVSGARWFRDKLTEQAEALEFVRWLMSQDIPYGLENPVSIISSRIRKPDQIIQPWQFGHPETKATCLWLFGLPKLQPTKLVLPMMHSVWREPPGPNRATNRSRTFQGIADAMADQWGKAISDYEGGLRGC
jgi:site-specific DNA-cytosine methylase